MAMYQVPQFIDQGDKLFFGLNFIQVSILIVGIFVSYGVFLSSQLIITNPAYAIIPVIPFFLFFFYFAAGKFNGRDTYLYGFKIFKIIWRNPRRIYAREADVSDLEERFGSLSLAQKDKDLNTKYQSKLDQEKSYYLNGEANSKIKFIKQLGSSLDANYINTSANLAKKNLEIQKRLDLINSIKDKNK